MFSSHVIVVVFSIFLAHAITIDAEEVSIKIYLPEFGPGRQEVIPILNFVGKGKPDIANIKRHIDDAMLMLKLYF